MIRSTSARAGCRSSRAVRRNVGPRELGLPRLLPRFGRLSRRLIGQAQSAQPCDLFLRSPSLLFIFGPGAGTFPRLLYLPKCGFSPGAGVVRIHAHLRWSTDRQLQLVRVQGCESADILPPRVLEQEEFHRGPGFSMTGSWAADGGPAIMQLCARSAIRGKAEI